MEKSKMNCFRCDESDESQLVDLYGYKTCQECKSKLGLLQDKTIKRHYTAFEKARAVDPKVISYEEEIANRFVTLEKDYISKLIKLLHVQDRLKVLK